MYIQSILIPCVALFLLDFVCADTIQQAHFKVSKGHKLSQGTQLKRITYTKTYRSQNNLLEDQLYEELPELDTKIAEQDNGVCVRFFQNRNPSKQIKHNISLALCASLCTNECGSATFSVRHKTCVTFRDKFYNFSMIWTEDPDWLVLFRDEPIQYGDWTLVFRAQKHTNSSLYDTWINTGHHDDNPLSSSSLNGCYRLDNLGRCKKHFRSFILDFWTNVKKVTL
nr:hypothetical protein BgiMline_023937 [Biomphalaria glabrata]